MKRQILTGFKLLALMIFLTGVVYPGIVSLISSLFFHKEAQGNLVERNGKIIGSKLIGQNFDSPGYFWSRPSATKYNTLPSGASNLSHLNPLLINKVTQSKEDFLQSNKMNQETDIPFEMITASASGLDPHISPEAALLQVTRVAQARGIDRNSEFKIVKLINEMTEKRQFSILGEPRINVLLLNLKLDSLK